MNDNGANRHGPGPKPSVPIPSEPVYGVADKANGSNGSAAYARAPFASAAPAGGYSEASVQRGSLAPVRQASYDGGAAPVIGNSFAMQPVEDQPANSGPYWQKTPKRYAETGNGNGYGYLPQPQPQPRYGNDKPAYRDDRGSYQKPYDRTGSTGDYVVAEGDTLYGIAQRFHISPGELAELNGINGSTIYVGQRLRVSGGPKYTGANRYWNGGPNNQGGAYQGRAYNEGDAYNSGYNKGRPAYQDEEAYSERKAPPPADYSSYRGYRPAYGNGKPGGYAGSPSYAKPERNDHEEEDRDANAQGYSDNGGYRQKPPYGQKSDDRYASRRDEPQGYDRQGGYVDRQRGYADRPGGYAPGYKKPKGSYASYSVHPGETLFDIARRNGLSHRELADYNDISPNAKLYPGQVLHIPKGSGYDWGGKGRDVEDRDDDRGGRPAPRAYEPDGYSRRPFSQNQNQNAPVEKNAGGGGERRVARADAPDERSSGRMLNDAGNGERPDSAAADKSQSRPVLAAQRELGPQDQPGNGGEAGTKECESLLSAPAPRAAKTFRQPVEGMIVAKYGSKDDGSFNDGINFSVPKGTPVKVAENGVVAYAGNELPGFGNLILVRHADGYVTAYAHNDELLVRRCDVVRRGQVISRAGATGKVTKPELHFELRKDSKPIDPEGYFSRS